MLKNEMLQSQRGFTALPRSAGSIAGARLTEILGFFRRCRLLGSEHDQSALQPQLTDVNGKPDELWTKFGLGVPIGGISRV